jgi:glycosyltransferase involved in cell wall biosynthesis
MEDPENKILLDGGWKKFDHFVFVTSWQRDQYILRFGIPYSKCHVIPNAVEKRYEPRDTPKNTDTIRFIYHTTPHRGLELVYPIFDALSLDYENIHLDVYSSFAIYGWANRDEPYVDLFTKIHEHPKMTYHGFESNETILKALDDAHIFLYPNIWKETSCIALIEAVKSGCLCIHPNYGALSETAANATIMYDYHEDAATHANIAYGITRGVLEHQKQDPEFLHRFTRSDRFGLARNDIAAFSSLWSKLLRELSEEKG